MQGHSDLESKIHVVNDRDDSEEYTRATTMTRTMLGAHSERVKAQKGQKQSRLSFPTLDNMREVGQSFIKSVSKTSGSLIRKFSGSTNDSDVQEVDVGAYEGEQTWDDSESAPGRKGGKRRSDGNDSDEYTPSDDERRQGGRGPPSRDRR